jgi:hypothetical protein
MLMKDGGEKTGHFRSSEKLSIKVTKRQESMGGMPFS